MNTSDSNLIPKISEQYVPHGCFDIIKKVVSKNMFATVWISGLSGNGKTFGVEQACAHAGRELIIINISNDTSEEDLIGSYVLDNGNMIWSDGPVLTAMRHGAVLCLDEIDQARSSIMALNTIAQGKDYYIKKTNEVVTPKQGFMLIGTANTKGDGNGMDKFAGAQIMNEAFLERFMIIIEQDYPSRSTEQMMLSKHTDNKEFIKNLTDMAHELRVSFNEGTIDFLLTTRRLVHIVQNYEIFKDELVALTLACARFNKDDQLVVIELYKSLTKPKAVESKARNTVNPKSNKIWLDDLGTISF